MTVGKGNWETITVHEDEDASKISRSGDRERQETSTHKEQILRDKEDSKRVLSLEDSKRMLSLEDKEDSKRVLSLLHESGDGTAPGDQSHMSWGKLKFCVLECDCCFEQLIQCALGSPARCFSRERLKD